MPTKIVNTTHRLSTQHTHTHTHTHTHRERERERQRQRERETEGERRTDRQTDRQTDRDRETQRDRDREYTRISEKLDLRKAFLEDLKELPEVARRTETKYLGHCSPKIIVEGCIVFSFFEVVLDNRKKRQPSAPDPSYLTCVFAK